MRTVSAIARYLAGVMAQNYRLLPDRLVNLAAQLQEASASVFLIGHLYDQTLDDLTRIANQCGKPWFVWCSPESQDAKEVQMGFWSIWKTLIRRPRGLWMQRSLRTS